MSEIATRKLPDRMTVRTSIGQSYRGRRERPWVLRALDIFGTVLSLVCVLALFGLIALEAYSRFYPN